MKKFHDNSINIVAYHYVRKIKGSKYPNIKGIEYNTFKKQIKFFKKKFHILSVDEFIEILESKKNNISKKPAILLTFDDGYKDHYDFVFPTLISEKITGCFYPPVNIFKGEILDVNKIHYILEKFNDKKILLDEILNYLIDEFNIHLNIELDKKFKLHSSKIPEFDDRKTMIIKKILNKDLSFKIRKATCDHFFKRYVDSNMESFSRKLYISLENLKEMNDNNMHIGSHGVNHLLWATLNEQKQKNEFINSRKFFKKNFINVENFSVCYPWGSYNSTSIKILKNQRVKFALTSNTGNINSKKKINSYSLPRFDANEFVNI